MVYEIHWTDNALNDLEVVREVKKLEKILF